MRANLEQEKALLSKPGDTLQETLDAIGMSQHELAERTGRPVKTINEIITGKAAITSETALQLEKVLGVPASFWLNLEYNYREELAKLQEKEKLAHQLEWLRLFPLNAMKKLGWIADTNDKCELVSNLLRFFQVASPDAWRAIYLSQKASVSYRMPLVTANEPGAIAAWLRQGEIQASKLKLPDFDKSSFKDVLKEVRLLVRDHPINYKEQLQSACTSAGVALVYTPNLPKATPCGAARWYNDHPLIQLSGRYKTNDSLWFTFYHEAGHILLHGKKDVFIEDVKGVELDQKQEHEADNFASRWLLTDEQYQQVIQRPVTPDSITAYARQFGTHPAIIVGRLEHKGLLKHNRYRHLKAEVRVVE